MAHKCTYNWTSAWNQCSRLLLTNRNNAALGYFCIGFTAETQKLSPYYTQSVCGTSPAFSFSVRQSKLNSNLSAVGVTVLGFPVPLTLQTLHKYSITNLSGLQPLIIVFISHKKKNNLQNLAGNWVDSTCSDSLNRGYLGRHEYRFILRASLYFWSIGL